MTGALPRFEYAEVPRRKRRWLAPLIVFGTLIVLVVIAFFVVDGFARSAAEGLVADKVRSALSLPEEAPVDVSIGGASVLLQAATGSLDRVDIGVKGLAVGDLSGDATLIATGVPIDQSKSISAVRIEFTAGQDDLQKLLTRLSTLPAASATIEGGAVRLGTQFTVLGLSVPVGVTVGLSASDGQLVVTPRSVELNGAAATAADLPSALRGLFDPQTICVADQLPRAFSLDSVEVKGSKVVVGVTGRSIALDGSLLSTKGSCPA